MKLSLARLSTQLVQPLTTTVVAGLAVHTAFMPAQDVLEKPRRRCLSAKELAQQ